MRKVIKIFVGLVFSALLAAVFVPLAMSVPAVQNAVGRRLMAHFSKKTGTTVKFDRIEVRRLNHVVVEGFYVADFEGDTLLYVPRVEAPIEQLPLWGRDMIFGHATLAGARMWIDRDSLGMVNIRQLVRRIPKSKGGGNVYINGITARNITFALTRHDRPWRTSGVDFSRFVASNIDVDVSRLAVEGSDLRIGISSLSFTEQTGWRLDRLKGELLVGRGVVALDDVELDSEGSRLRMPRVALRGEKWRSFGSFADSVSLDVSLTDSRLDTRLVRRFLPLDFDETVDRLTASFGGALSALTGRVERVRMGGTALEALEFSSRGLPRLREAEFVGKIARLTSTDPGRFYAPLEGVGGVDFAGDFAGSLAEGVEAAGRLGVTEARYGDFGAAGGEFDIKARLGRRAEVKAAGTVRGVAYKGRRLGSADVNGEWCGALGGGASGGEFSTELRAANPGAEWGVNGALTAAASGTPQDFEATASLRDVLYVSPRGSVATPLIELSARIAADEKTASMTSALADARVRLINGEAVGEATLKDADELLGLFAPGLQAASGARAEGVFDTHTRRGELRVEAAMIDYRGVLLADPRLEMRRGGPSTGSGTATTLTALLTAEELYAGALRIPALRLAAEMDGRRTRLTLDGANYLTVSGLTTHGVADSLRVDLAGFDLAALGGLTPKGTRVDGYVDIIGKRRVNAQIGARNIDAALLQPLVGGALTGTQGLASMNLRVDGEPKNLRVDGALDILGFSSTVAYTGARYHVDHAAISIKDSRATLPPTRVRDRFGGSGSIEMDVDLAQAKISLKAAADGLLAFDRTASGSFGGRVFASGTVLISSERMGTALAIDARTDPGTVLRLPLSGKSNSERADFVSFAAPEPPKAEETELKKRLQSRVRRQPRTTATSLEMIVRVTDAAEVHLALDPRLGRGITARGQGVISLGLDPQSRAVAVTGDYTIRQGRMELSMMDVLNKNFTIAPGSAIRWSGAPGDAALDVRASYRVRTSLAPLLGTGLSERAGVPVDCVLALAGRLDAPTVAFDVELPSADTDQRQIAAEAMNTDELRSMQFLSLLVTGNFASAGSIGAGTGAGTEALASGSMGFDILTGQLSNLLSSDGYDVYFRYRPEDNFLTNRVDMGFSAGFARDRLRLEIEGNYVDDRAAVSLGTQRGMGNLAGDVSLTWVIDEAGNLRLKVFSQTIDRLNETQGLQESGLGIYYRKDFDRLSDIFRRKRVFLPSEKTKKLK